jgi:hypothetical protein
MRIAKSGPAAVFVLLHRLPCHHGPQPDPEESLTLA